MNDPYLPTVQDVPRGRALVIPGADDDQQAVLLLDTLDMEQAMAEIRGDVLETFVYVVKGRTYTNKRGEAVVIPDKQQLSYAGVKEAARLYKNVRFGARVDMMPDGSWMITAWAHNLRDNLMVEYPWPYPAFDSSKSDQSIEFRATVGKAMRNALANSLPVAYVNKMVQLWLEQQGKGGEHGTLLREFVELMQHDQIVRDSLAGRDPARLSAAKLREGIDRMKQRAASAAAQAGPALAAPPAPPEPEAAEDYPQEWEPAPPPPGAEPESAALDAEVKALLAAYPAVGARLVSSGLNLATAPDEQLIAVRDHLRVLDEITTLCNAYAACWHELRKRGKPDLAALPLEQLVEVRRIVRDYIRTAVLASRSGSQLNGIGKELTAVSDRVDVGELLELIAQRAQQLQERAEARAR